ncbi:Uncharacterised protein [Bordetella pertussis]|nr:Uncharacterised protein [Bordetella pertussis]
MLRVERHGQPDGQLAQLVLHRVQRLAAETQQAAQLAAGDLAVVHFHLDGGARPGRQRIGHRQALGVAGRGHRLQRIDRRARQQGLAALQRDVEGVALLVEADAGQLVQFRDGLVALVQQVVGRVPVLAARDHDLLVQVVDALQVAVGLLDRGRDLRVEAVALVFQLLVGGIDLGDQAVGLADHVGAHGRIGRLGGRRVGAGEQARERRRDADGAIAEQIVHLRHLREVGAQLGAAALRADQLAVQEAVVLARHGIHLHAAAEKALPGLAGAGGRGDDTLAAVADRRGIVDVVAGRLQAGLRSVQAGQRQVVQIHASNAP